MVNCSDQGRNHYAFNVIYIIQCMRLLRMGTIDQAGYKIYVDDKQIGSSQTAAAKGTNKLLMCGVCRTCNPLNLASRVLPNLHPTISKQSTAYIHKTVGTKG